MDIGLHHGANCCIYGPMAGQRALSFERSADHMDVEMTPSVARAGVPGMTMAVVLDKNVKRSQFLLQCITYPLHPVRGAHGNTFLKGRTSVRR